jgi:hypothetical protein
MHIDTTIKRRHHLVTKSIPTGAAARTTGRPASATKAGFLFYGIDRRKKNPLTGSGWNPSFGRVEETERTIPSSDQKRKFSSAILVIRLMNDLQHRC